jgi:hypothetical protein
VPSTSPKQQPTTGTIMAGFQPRITEYYLESGASSLSQLGDNDRVVVYGIISAVS